MLERAVGRWTLLCWSLLVLLRFLVALTSTSVIHPDEHFQNPEISAGDKFNYPHGALLRTWEWNGYRPCRSIVPVWGSTGSAFSVLRLLVGSYPSARLLLIAQRLGMWALSLAIDYSVWSLSTSHASVLLFASSPIAFTFLLRPFSNSLETVLLAVAFALAQKSTSRRPTTLHRRSMGLLGGVLALGVWTRITFVAFAGPVVGVVALRGIQVTRQSSRQLLAVLALGAPAVVSFVLTSLLCAACDTLYFTSRLWPLQLTPINLLQYNLASSNLAEHGLHPRYLHLVANWPMLFGAGIWAVADVLWRHTQAAVSMGNEGKSSINEPLYLASFIVPTLVLSIQPHQEPRFLVPLTVPLVLLIPQASFFRIGTSTARWQRRSFWSIWIIHTIVFTVLFGYLHQGGLIPALLKLNGELRTPKLLFLGAEATPELLNLVFWKTFMPPRHLLIPLSDQGMAPRLNVTDLAGCDVAQLAATLQSRSLTAQTLLVAPAYLYDAAAVELSKLRGELRPKQMFKGQTFGVHVDMDRIDQSIGARWDRLGVGVWQV